GPALAAALGAGALRDRPCPPPVRCRGARESTGGADAGTPLGGSVASAAATGGGVRPLRAGATAGAESPRTGAYPGAVGRPAGPVAGAGNDCGGSQGGGPLSGGTGGDSGTAGQQSGRGNDPLERGFAECASGSPPGDAI